MKKFIKLSILFLAMVMALSGCKKEPNLVPLGNNGHQHSEYVLGDKTREINKEWEKCINGVVTSNVITLSPSVGTAIEMPKVGEILLYPGISEKFPYGFLGKVTEVSQGRIVTESVSLEEAFKKLIIDYENIDVAQYVGEVTDANGNPIPPSPKKMIKSSKDDWEVTEIRKFPISAYIIGNSSSTARVKLDTCEIEVGMTLSWKEVIDNHNTVIQRFTVTPHFNVSTGIVAEISGDNKGDIQIGHIPFLIPGPVPLYCEIKIYAGVDVKGKISLSSKLSYSHSTTYGFEWNGSLKAIKENSPANGLKFSINSLSIDGRIGIGPSIKGSVYLFKVNNVQASVEIKGEALLAHKLKFQCTSEQALSGSLYEIMRDFKSKRSFVLGAELGFSLELGKWVEFNPKLQIPEYEIPISEEWLLPKTADLICQNNTSTNKTVKYRLKDDVFLPGRYGMIFYDENKNTVAKHYFNDNATYISQLSDNPVSFPFTLPDGATTYASPVYKLLGFEFVDYKTKVKMYNLSGSILDIIPDEFIAIIEELGLEINGGIDPPIINGSYLIAPLIRVKSNFPDNMNNFCDMDLTFYDQKPKPDLTVKINYEQCIGNIGTGLGAFISGEGNKFSVFVPILNTDPHGHITDLIKIFSGELEETGIKNMHFVLIMKDDHGDPYNEFIENGQGRLFKDGDGFSEKKGKGKSVHEIGGNPSSSGESMISSKRK